GKYLTPPTYLSAPSISNIKSNSADIAWTTDRSSTSIVRYGKSRTGLDASSGQMDSVTNHAVELNGLDPSATYYFQVQSLDENRDYSPDSAYSTTYSFSTLQAPAISNVQVDNITLTAADISWETTTVASSSLHYGKNSDFANEVEDISGANATKHSVKLSSLTHSTRYSFRLNATDIDGNELTSDNYNFETLPMPRVDNLKATLLTDQARAGAKINWTTNVDASSIVRYSVGGADEKESVKSKLEKEHEIIIEGLSDQTDYKIVVSGADSLGNLAEGSTVTIKTPNDTRPPAISNIQIETSNVGLNKQDKAQAVVSWSTDEPATSRVEYGLGLGSDNYEKMTNEDTNLVSEHVSVINDLDPTTPYHLRVNSTDHAGNLGKSDDQIIVSAEVQKSTLQLLLEALQKVFGWMKI
ncbi:MAG: fibronectin type III domain-containing protein, partial [Candidatus Berkelbacteria bacterium]|nr:fibronectin type III domain-containing protein [Candidatus Berkelbacteria bacterium]